MLQKKASSEPIGFNLLPSLFTLFQLQSLYEAIYGEPLDKRNFRKRVADLNYIEKQIRLIKQGQNGEPLYISSTRTLTVKPLNLNYELC